MDLLPVSQLWFSFCSISFPSNTRTHTCAYRCPFGLPSPARARAGPGSVTSGLCLAWSYSLAGRTGGQPMGCADGPNTGLFRAGPARKSMKPRRARAVRRPIAPDVHDATPAAAVVALPRPRLCQTRYPTPPRPPAPACIGPPAAPTDIAAPSRPPTSASVASVAGGEGRGELRRPVGRR